MSSSIWAPIDGETPIDISDLKDRQIKNRADLNLAEARNIRRPHVKYLSGRLTRRKAPFDYSWFLHLHGEMFCDVWSFAGQVRTDDLNIGIPWQLIQEHLMALVLDLRCWDEHGTYPRHEQAVRLHHRAVSIHPFRNGNGRWSRMLANIWLRLHKQALVQWPEETIGTKSVIRDKYLEAIRAADRGDYGSLLELHVRYSVTAPAPDSP